MNFIEEVIIAKPNKKSFFGLTMLESFSRDLDNHIKEKKDCPVLLDLSFIKIWDIASLLWMTIALEYYKGQGLSFRLKLPESNSSMSYSDIIHFDKSADYLRRWRFDRALTCIDSQIENLLIDSQKNYFNPCEPRMYYLAQSIKTDKGLLDTLLSRRLAEIKLLSENGTTGTSTITPETIAQCIGYYQNEHIGNILTKTCNMDRDKAELFSNHLINEGLHNVKDHPNATIGMVAISPMGNSNWLLLCVADNGHPIPKTIYPRFREDMFDATGLPEMYSRDINIDLKCQITHHATKKGVSRKLISTTGKEPGMGLTYIKEDAVKLFAGNLRIVTDGLYVEYVDSCEEPKNKKIWNNPWSGNLLRIAIPISPKNNKINNNLETETTI